MIRAVPSHCSRDLNPDSELRERDLDPGRGGRAGPAPCPVARIQCEVPEDQPLKLVGTKKILLLSITTCF
ncbi:hypothetical protein Y1Q_0022872 [Alligator mississippiensis]|uniref:Uncharacterized protein n=1 Tax=Alligator mississippiensis TaxID=8496 RepID=A0A151N4T7_ALLMI|nr:hypothetical protein Y1Q_0022872 [Alligator mississippiensis]